MNIISKALGLLALGLSTASAYAQQERALPILTQGRDVASVALGGAHYGTSGQAHLYTNPSAALYAERPFSLSTYYQHQRLGESALRAMGFASSYRLGERHAFMLGARYSGGLKHTEITQGEQTRYERSLYDLTLDLGYSLRLGKFSPYITAHYILSDQMRRVSTMTLGVGASYRDQMTLLGQSWRYSLVAKASNIGPSFSYIRRGSAVYPPSSVALGGALQTDGEQHQLGMQLGVEHYYAPSAAASTQLQTGLEYAYRRLLMARVGYCHDTNGLSQLTLGLGLRYRGLHIDLAYARPNNQIVSPQMSLGLGFSL